MRNYSPGTSLAYLMGPILIIVSHLGSLLVFVTGLSWGAIAWIIGWYLIRMLATTAIYHRLLTHKSYKAPRFVLWIGCLIATTAGQMGPSWWKAHHCSHHQYADQLRDPHSPCIFPQTIKGFYWSQGGWLFSPEFFPAQLPSDVEKNLPLKVLDRLHFIPLLIVAGLSYYFGGLEYLTAFCLSTTLLFHGVQTVNSLSHLVGEQPFKTQDFSRNNGFVAFLTLGEGWHNLHHAFEFSCRHGMTIRGGKVVDLPDPTYSFIQMLEFFKLASHLKIPTEANLLKGSNMAPKKSLVCLVSSK